jgi:hypothetical protein
MNDWGKQDTRRRGIEHMAPPHRSTPFHPDGDLRQRDLSEAFDRGGAGLHGVTRRAPDDASTSVPAYR